MFMDKLRSDNPLVKTDNFKNHQEKFEKNFGAYAIRHEKSNTAIENGIKAINNALYEQIKNDDINTKFEIFNNIYYISGTYNDNNNVINMLKAYKKIVNSQDEALNFRLALIGFELSKSKHKSLYDILSDSHKAGVVGSEDLTSIISMDDSAISPLSKDEIKNNCFEYYSPLKSESSASSDTNKEQNTSVSKYRLSPIDMTFMEKFSYENTNDKTKDKSYFAIKFNHYEKYLKNNFSPALHPYINTENKLHFFINSYLGFRKTADSSLSDKLFLNWARKPLSSLNLQFNNNDNKNLKIRSDKELYSDLNDIKSITSMAINSLSSAEKFSGTVYRGDWVANNCSQYRVNNIISTSSFLSTSADFQTAHNFAVQSMDNKNKQLTHGAILIIDLKGKSGVDLSSVNTAEQEILLMPDAKLKVKKIYKLNNKETNENIKNLKFIDSKVDSLYNDFRILKSAHKIVNTIFNKIPEDIRAKLPKEIQDVIEINNIDDIDETTYENNYFKNGENCFKIMNLIDLFVSDKVGSFILLEEVDN